MNPLLPCTACKITPEVTNGQSENRSWIMYGIRCKCPRTMYSANKNTLIRRWNKSNA